MLACYLTVRVCTLAAKERTAQRFLTTALMSHSSSQQPDCGTGERTCQNTQAPQLLPYHTKHTVTGVRARCRSQLRHRLPVVGAYKDPVTSLWHCAHHCYKPCNSSGPHHGCLLQLQQLIIINVIKPTSLLLLLWRLAGPCLLLLLVLVCLLLLLNVPICMLLLLFWWPGVHKVWELGPHILQLDLHAR